MKLEKWQIERLREIGRLIVAEYKLYNQGTYPSGVDRHTCNSPCCFSGWAMWLHIGTEEYNRRLTGVTSFGQNSLKESLCLEGHIAEELFAGGDCSRLMWQKPQTLKGAKDGAKYLEEFIERYS